MGTKILIGNNMEKLKEIESESVDCIVSSPPYFGLRDYGVEGQFGLEETLEDYIDKTVLLFEELRRVLKPQGTVWWNLGDSYASKSSAWGGRGKNSILNKTGLEDKQRRNTVVPDGLKAKDLMMIPSRVAIALSENGWYLRSEIIWHKPNPMPESVKDRPTSAHEKIYLFAKNKKYYYDADAIRVPQKQDSIARAGRNYWDTNKVETGNYSIPNIESAKKLNQKVLDTVAEGKIPMANKRNVWTVTTKPFRGAHFAVFPPDLIEPCIKAGCPVGGTVLDPFGGSGTTGLVANNLGRDAVLIELNEDYVDIAKKRINDNLGLFSEVKDG